MRKGKLPPERRQYKRIKKHFILKYYEIDNMSKKYEASQLKNISLGGMCLITERAFEPNTILGIDLKTPFISDVTHIKGLVQYGLPDDFSFGPVPRLGVLQVSL